MTTLTITLAGQPAPLQLPADFAVRAAAQSALRAEQALTGAEEILTDVQDAGTAATGAIAEARTGALGDVETARTGALEDLNAARLAALAEVETEGGEQIALAEAQAGISTTQAGIATTQAGIATGAALTATAASRQPTLGDFVRFGGGLQRRRVRMRTSIGRAYMLPSGAFAFTTAENQERPFYDASGNLLGYLMQPPAAYVGGNAQATALTGANAITTVGGTSGGAPIPAGDPANTYADRFGGTGACLVLPERNAAGVQRRWQGLPAINVVAGDVVRCIIPGFQVFGALSGASTFTPVILRATSGSAPGARYTLTLNADGTIPETLTAAGTPERGRLVEIGTMGGKPLYGYYFEVRATATGTIYPEFIHPAAMVGATFVFHDCPLLQVNPTDPPVFLPIGGTKTFAVADQPDAGSAVELRKARFWRLGRVIGRKPASSLAVPSIAIEGNRTAISGPLWPYENDIEILPPEAEDRAGLLPCANSLFDHIFLPSFRNPSFRGEGYFGDPISSPSSGTAGSYTVRGLSDVSWFGLPWIAWFTSPTYCSSITGAFNIYSNSSTFATQLGQIGTEANRISELRASSTISIEFGSTVSHPWPHSRFLRVQDAYGVTVDKRNYVGNVRFTDATAVTVNNFVASGIGRCFQFVRGSGALPMAVNRNMLICEGYSSDGDYWDSGLFSGVTENFLYIDPSFLNLNFYQSAPDMPIMVNFGGGWQTIQAYATAQSITVPQALERIPKNRRYSRYGRMSRAYNAATPRSLPADVIVEPNPDLWFAVPQWVIDNGATIGGDKPGFQFHATDTHWPDGTLRIAIPIDDVFLSAGNGPPSATNPHVMLGRSDGRYRRANEDPALPWFAEAHVNGRAVMPFSSTHGDVSQKAEGSAGAAFVNLTYRDGIMRGDNQLQFGGGSNDANSRIDNYLTERVLGVSPLYSCFRYGNCIGTGATLKDYALLSMIPAWRFQDGSMTYPAVEVNKCDITFDNVSLAARAVNDTTEADPSTLGNSPTGVFIGTEKRIRVPQITGATVAAVTPRLDANGNVVAPTLAMVLAPGNKHNDRGHMSLNAPIETLEFSDFGISFLGFDPAAPIRRFKASARDYFGFIAWRKFIHHRDPEGHAQILNTAAVGSEVVVYEDFDGAQQNILRLPGYKIDPYWSGWGAEPFITITDDGRFVVARALAFVFPINLMLVLRTLAPDGSPGPIVSVDVRQP